MRTGIKFEILENLSPFENKIIEALSIQLTYPNNKHVVLTSIYRSNGVIPNVTAAQQMEGFITKFSQLLSELSATKKLSYVFLDANINILNHHSHDAVNYLNCIFSNGYLQTTCKASRIHNESKTLIDHILSNSGELRICSGTILSDVSDHFFTFVVPNFSPSPKQVHRTISSRNFSHNNLLGFKRELGQTNSDHVYSKENVDEAYDEFWNSYSALFDLKFPLRRKRFNKNIHKMQSFMTNGLLISRSTKNTLHKTSIVNPSAENVNKFKTFKTIYQRVLCAAKKLYFTSKLQENANNPKKTWETLNEILGKNTKSETLD